MILPVFQDRIYWTDRDRAAVLMANRLTGQDIQTLAENLNDPHDIVVFHQLLQPQGVCVCVCVRRIETVHGCWLMMSPPAMHQIYAAMFALRMNKSWRLLTDQS